MLFEQISRQRDASWRALGDELRELAEDEHDHDLRAIAILFSNPAEDGPDDRFARLARVAVASAHDEVAFVRVEAARFFASLHERVTQTAALAAEVLLRRRDPEAIAALAAAITTNPPHAGTMRSLLDFMAADPAFAPVLAALVTRRFGRAEEGEPVLHAARLARMDPGYRFDHVETAPPETRAAALAGLLVVDASWRTQTLQLLTELDPKKERQAAAALALFRVAHESNAHGFAEAAARWLHVKRSKHAGAELTRWFEANAATIR
jgi:hypothetical protein